MERLSGRYRGRDIQPQCLKIVFADIVDKSVVKWVGMDRLGDVEGVDEKFITSSSDVFRRDRLTERPIDQTTWGAAPSRPIGILVFRVLEILDRVALFRRGRSFDLRGFERHGLPCCHWGWCRRRSDCGDLVGIQGEAGGR